MLAVFILFDLAGFWMWTWAIRNGLTVSWMLVLGGLIVAITYFLSAALVFPRRPDECADLDEYYWQHKCLVVSGVIAANLVVTVFTFVRYPPGSHFWVWFFQAIYYGPLIALLFTTRRRVDLSLLAFLIVSYFGAMLAPTSDWGAMTGLEEASAFYPNADDGHLPRRPRPVSQLPPHVRMSEFHWRRRPSQLTGPSNGRTRLTSVLRQALAVFLGTAVLTHGSPGYAQASVDPLEQRGLDIRDQFISAIKSCGVQPTSVPGVVVKTSPMMVAYLPTDRAVHLSRWAELDPSIQGMMTGWAAKGTLSLKPDQMFDEIFNKLLVAHELGHYLQDMSGRLQKIDNWQSEVEANQIAIAFFSLKADEAARLPARIENFTTFLTALPNPVPKAEDTRSYFIKNYEKLGNDPEAYGWYQGALMRAAWQSRKERDFCGWVALNPPMPLPAKAPMK